MQHNINLSVPRQGDRNELLAKVAKRAERAQLLVYLIIRSLAEVGWDQYIHFVQSVNTHTDNHDDRYKLNNQKMFMTFSKNYYGHTLYK